MSCPAIGDELTADDADEAQIDAEELGVGVGASPPVYPLSGLTEKIIGAAMEVHRELGPGFLEKVYEMALVKELALRGFNAKSQAPIQVLYKGDSVGTYFADLLVSDQVICEIKVADALIDIHKAQLLHYLKATGKQVGLLLNFGAQKLEVKRMVKTK